MSENHPAVGQQPPAHQPSSWINSRTRAAALREFTDSERSPLDVLVIGGGINGVGIALDAASRGLRVALVERRDLASGTSGFSSKLAHGGLRYLAQAQIGVARESAIERHHLLTSIAPHLVRPVQTLIPQNRHLSRKDAAMVYGGMRVGDLLRRTARTPSSLLPAPSRISAQEVALLTPAIDKRELRGGLTYWDCQIEDDARLVTALARTAAAHGARVITRCEATDVNARSATLTDSLTGHKYIAYADVVINATGVWAGDIADGIRTSPSRGTHLVVRSTALGDPRAILAVPVEGTLSRYVFAIPHPDGVCYLGITDDPAPDADPYAPGIGDGDIAFILDTLNSALASGLTEADIVGTFSGLRPLVSDVSADATSDLSRRHVLIDRPGQPLTITGGKLTTYRQMAEETVDAAVRRLGRKDECVTKSLPLTGAAEPGVLRRIDAPPRLVRRYGTEARAVAALAEDDPSLLEPVSARSPILGVEVAYAVLAEGALNVDDFLDRRVRAGFVPADREDIRWECTKIFERTAAALRTRN